MTKVYDPEEYTISFGPIILKGFFEGEMLRIERDTDAFVDVIGTDGEVVRSKTNDHRATATAILMQTSLTNDALSVQYNLDISSPAGAGVLPFLVRDRQGTTVILAEKAWIARTPNLVLDRQATAREWKFRLGKIKEHHGSA